MMVERRRIVGVLFAWHAWSRCRDGPGPMNLAGAHLAGGHGVSACGDRVVLVIWFVCGG